MSSVSQYTCIWFPIHRDFSQFLPMLWVFFYISFWYFGIILFFSWYSWTSQNLRDVTRFIRDLCAMKIWIDYTMTRSDERKENQWRVKATARGYKMHCKGFTMQGIKEFENKIRNWGHVTGSLALAPCRQLSIFSQKYIVLTIYGSKTVYLNL